MLTDNLRSIILFSKTFIGDQQKRATKSPERRTLMDNLLSICTQTVVITIL